MSLCKPTGLIPHTRKGTVRISIAYYILFVSIKHDSTKLHML